MRKENESFDGLVRRTRGNFQDGEQCAKSARKVLASIMPAEAPKALPQNGSVKSHSKYLLDELKKAQEEKDEARIAQLESFIRIIEDNTTYLSDRSSEKGEVQDRFFWPLLLPADRKD